MKRKFFFRKRKKNPYLHNIASRDYYLSKKRGWKKNIFLWLAFFIILGLFYFCFYSNFFAINEIEINRENEGQKVSDQEIKNYIFSIFQKNKFLVFPQGNLLIFDKKMAESAIKENPNIENIYIVKKFFNNIKITVEEKVAIATLALIKKQLDDEPVENSPEIPIENMENVKNKDDNNDSPEKIKEKIKKVIEYNYYLIDKNGEILEEIGEPNIQLPLIYDQREISQYPYSNYDELLFVLDLSKKFPQRIEGVIIKSFKLRDNEDDNKLIVLTSEEWEIYFNLKEDVRRQLEKVFLILQGKTGEQRSKLKYLDLRFEDRIIVNPSDF